MTKSEYKIALRDLRVDIIDSQYALRASKTPVQIIITGFDGAGKGEVINLLSEWLDPRSVETTAFWESTEEERSRPYFWRYWRAAPTRGRIRVLFGSYYGDLIAARTYDDWEANDYRKHVERIRDYERMLVDDGALIAKFWLHLSESEQADRLNDLEANSQFHWRIEPAHWKDPDHYSRFWTAAKESIAATDQPGAQWRLIEAKCPYERNLAVAGELVRQFQEAADSIRTKPTTGAKAPDAASKKGTKRARLRLDDPTPPLEADAYEEALTDAQNRLRELAWEAHQRRIATVAVFEGWDAAGKGGCIRRIIHALDARLYQVIPIAAPSEEEFARHYLWRFWRRLPMDGQIAFFDRSWYGRVLVERVEGFASEEEWSRAFEEINKFEEQLVDHGVVLVKYWLDISKETQAKRFEKRRVTPHKNYKLSEEDWRNRKKWDQYNVAVDDMLERTSPPRAPWNVVNAEDKRNARIAALRIFCDRLEARLGHSNTP